MKTIALNVHGFNVWDKGRGTINRLQPFFTSKGVNTITFRTGVMGVIKVYNDNLKHAERLAKAAFNAKLLDQQVLACGHSNGCSIIHLATTKFNAPIEKIAYINPALDSDAAPGPQVKAFHVYYSPSDLPVRAAKYLPFLIWGDMGARGYKGADPRCWNINKEDSVVSSRSHSDFAQAEILAYWGPVIVKNLLDG